MDTLTDFRDFAAWNESERTPGNWWRFWDGARLTIFRRGEGWRWCIDGERRSYSRRTFETVMDALDALGEKLGVKG